MGVTKTDQFTEAQNRVAALFKALAHPARVAILEHLLAKRACVCGDLVDVLPLAQATVSQHLKELKNAGLIQGTVEGTSVCYCLREESIQELSDFLKLVSETVKNQGFNCC